MPSVLNFNNINGYRKIYNNEHSDLKDLSSIVFYKEGNWYRAYEYSAYLAHYFNDKLDELNKLTPIKHESSLCEDGIINVGLQLKSLNKFFPDVIPDIEEDKLTIKLSEVNVNKEDLEIWKRKYPYKESKNKHKTTQVFNNPCSVISIMHDILQYPLESHTLLETYIFVQELKNKCLSLIF